MSELPELSRDLLTSCTVMTNMTVGLKQFLKSEPTPEPSGVDPVPIIQYAIGVCRETAVRARGRISYEGPATLPKVRIGSTELTQVLINVVANGAQALLARNKSGGRVVVRRAEAGTRRAASPSTTTAPACRPRSCTRSGRRSSRRGPRAPASAWRSAGAWSRAPVAPSRSRASEGQGTTVTFTLPKV